MTNDGRLSATNGCYHLNAADGAKTSKNWFGFVPEQDTVFTVLSGTDCGGAAVNFLTTLNLSGKTIKIGSYIAVPDGYAITAATISSGSAVMYNNVILNP